MIAALPKFIKLSPNLVKGVFDRLLISYKGKSMFVFYKKYISDDEGRGARQGVDQFAIICSSTLYFMQPLNTWFAVTIQEMYQLIVKVQISMAPLSGCSFLF